MDRIQALRSGVILVNTSGSLLKLLMPMMEYLYKANLDVDKRHTQIPPSTGFRIVERTARVSAPCSKV